ncbi:MAG TPA: co-chaperone GroES [Candidatus Caccalectryoclostridium excrementigallinarum]|uniref:Co-chaperonin GroES n=1 Tax=Candidatus Caccalectryoclostridium excrementigallinarum TaxID=2840710 RepID=A0A9D1SIZ7_9FIRM|nr:co-chaperone GroES [Candidatus Caccalectryoclostridium excrementigallinarum]
MTIKPLFDKIVVEAVESEEKTAGGLFLPDSAKEKPQSAKVLAVGPGGMVDGKEVTMQIKVGDVILYNKYAGSDFKLDGKEVTILRQSDVLAVLID